MSDALSLLIVQGAFGAVTGVVLVFIWKRFQEAGGFDGDGTAGMFLWISVSSLVIVLICASQMPLVWTGAGVDGASMIPILVQFITQLPFLVGAVAGVAAGLSTPAISAPGATDVAKIRD